MKRTTILILTVITLICTCLSAAGCRTSEKTVKKYDSYEIFLQSNTLGGVDDSVTPMISRSLFEVQRTEKKDENVRKSISVLGEKYDCRLDGTQIRRTLAHSIDFYTAHNELGKLVLIALYSQTGKLREYTVADDGVDPEYKSDVNKNSSEKEFAAYAKKIIAPYCSIEDCEMEIETELMKYNSKYDCYNHHRTMSGFVKEENYPEYYANYTFTFYKTFAGVRQYNENSVTVTNTGEIRNIFIEIQDELYEPFADADIKVDTEQAKKLAEEAVKKSLSKVFGQKYRLEYEPYTVATSDGELWLLMNTVAYISQSTDTDTNEVDSYAYSIMYQYAFKIAELTDLPQ